MRAFIARRTLESYVLLLGGVDRNDVARTHSFERHYSINESKKSIILPPTNIATRVNFCSALTHYDTTRVDPLASSPLDTKTIRVAVPTVTTGSYTFLVCHDANPLSESGRALLRRARPLRPESQ